MALGLRLLWQAASSTEALMVIFYGVVVVVPESSATPCTLIGCFGENQPN